MSYLMGWKNENKGFARLRDELCQCPNYCKVKETLI